MYDPRLEDQNYDPYGLRDGFDMRYSEIEDLDFQIRRMDDEVREHHDRLTREPSGTPYDYGTALPARPREAETNATGRSRAGASRYPSRPSEPEHVHDDRCDAIAHAYARLDANLNRMKKVNRGEVGRHSSEFFRDDTEAIEWWLEGERILQRIQYLGYGQTPTSTEQCLIDLSAGAWTSRRFAELHERMVESHVRVGAYVYERLEQKTEPLQLPPL